MSKEEKTVSKIKPESIENEIKSVLSCNLALRLLLSGRYSWAIWATIFSVIYWLFGLIVASVHDLQELIDFLQFYKLYVVLLAIILSASAASWYSQTLLDVLGGIYKSFKIESQTLLDLIKHWLRYISLPTLLITSIIYVVVGSLILLHGDLSQLLATMSTIFNLMTDWTTAYLGVLLIICGLILGSAIQAFLLIFRYPYFGVGRAVSGPFPG